MAGSRFRLGLVVGKLAPLHLGHEYLVAQAAAQCERLLILSYTKPEFDRCDVDSRRGWLADRFPDHESVVIDDRWLRSACTQHGVAFQPLPDNAADDATHQAFLAWLLRDVLRRSPDVMFCSEDYGSPCAATLSAALGKTVRAVVVDRERSQVPISATRIRQDPLNHRVWMAPEVAASFVRRVVLLGGESSGKTTLAQALAQRFQTDWVPEYGRQLWEEQGGALSESDLLRIAQEQIRREKQAARQVRGLLFCDTSPLTTLGYSLWMFGRADPALVELAQRPYDAVVLCLPDFSFVQDGTRREEGFRLTQHAWYLEQMALLEVPVHEASGSLDQRVAAAAAWLEGS
ncbi:AAA family ATPase [Ideonella sp. YS5]|uniref:AAA family ATPase n=1 Tax=Ideonella sp. YS5 TaxID=3453714 RepID=UPI003EEFD794